MASSFSSSSSSSSVPFHQVECLHILQNCGPITIHQPNELTAEGEAQVTFVAKEDIVVLFDRNKKSLVIYGLGSCSYFSFHGKTERRYIENSYISKTGAGIATENGHKRSEFYGPDKAITILNVKLKLNKLHLAGDSILASINPECINDECSESRFFYIELRGNAELKCPLKATLVDFKLYDKAGISTNTITHGESLLWSLNKANFTIETCKYVEGINVSGVLQLTVVKKRTMLCFNVQQSTNCKYIAPRDLKINKRFRTMGYDSEPSVAPSLSDLFGGQDEFEAQFHDLVRYPNGTFGPSSDPYPTFSSSSSSSSSSGLSVDDEIAEAVRQSIIQANIDDAQQEKRKRKRVRKSGAKFDVVGNTKATDIPYNDDMQFLKPCNICLENVAIVTLNCGHMTHCYKCFLSAYTKEVDKKGVLRCNECRTVVDRVTVPYGR